MTINLDRPPAAEAGSELVVPQKWEESTAWLLNHTSRWPKAAHFTLTQRVDPHALDVVEMLVHGTRGNDQVPRSELRPDPERTGEAGW